jgi:hypothetical protein
MDHKAALMRLLVFFTFIGKFSRDFHGKEIEIMDFCFVAPYSVMVRNNRLEGRCCLHLQG